jgi:pimeloyl-ACP methyl ester carboxylesterase
MLQTINKLEVFTEGNKKNIPIIFVHGFPFDHTMWDNQVRSLKRKYFCVTYDIRGLGKSVVGDGQYTMESYVDDLFKIIEKLDLNKPILCGMSMGGYISLRAVEKDQSKFRGLILCDTKSEADTNQGKLNRAAGIKKINTEGLEPFVEEFVKNCFAPETPKTRNKLYNSVLEKSKIHKPQGVKGALIAMLSRTDTTKFLKKIKIPTLAIVGSFDKLTPTTQMRDMAEKIKNSEFAIVPRAGHMSPIENHKNVNNLISGFLKRRVD